MYAVIHLSFDIFIYLCIITYMNTLQAHYKWTKQQQIGLENMPNAKIIAAIVGKGGSGKSTLLYSLAKYLHDQKKKVLVLDTDPNTSLTLQYQRRLLSVESADLDKLGYPEVRSIQLPKSASAAQNQILTQSDGYDYVLIDMAGALTLQHEAIALISHLVLVPTLTEDKFIVPMLDSLNILMDLQDSNDGLPIVVVARLAFPRNGVMARYQNKLLDDRPCLDATTEPMRAKYEIADKFGYSITELDKIGNKSDKASASKAATQMRRMCKEIKTTVDKI